MMEGINQAGQEEYIWAMRTSYYRESDSDLWKQRRSIQTTSSKRFKSADELSESVRQTKVMASLVPDEVIYNWDDYSHRQYDACFLFGDVSGFTELCEKYTKTGISGPSRMTQVLNKYMGSMVQEVLSYNGDVLKFSGDAFLAVFKASENETMRDAVHESLDCALVIQKNYGSYLTDVGVMIRVKLAISAGLVTFALIGDANNSHYVVVGKPIWDVKAAESISSAGDIIVAPAAWHYVGTNEYQSYDMPDHIHVRIVGIGPNWRSVQKNVRQQHQSQTQQPDADDSGGGSSSEGSVISTQVMSGIDEFSLRPAVNAATRLKIKDELRRFIIAPVMKSIDMNEPFEYLTEMRQAVIVFINVVSTKLETRETVILADQAYKIVCSVVDKMKGCVNKVSLFDKDLMFVVIFGLRGLKHELECQVALKCARACNQAIKSLPNVLTCSIGVTTGKTYCGVFGHTLRREYTVISLIVNKAARLMVAYKNKVTCDRETFLHSKLEARNFILQAYRPLKGISHPGPVYEFKEVEAAPDELKRINPCPLLGRIEYMKLYSRLIEIYMDDTQETGQEYKMLLIRGEARQGKTRLLDEMIYVSPPSMPINRFSLTLRDHQLPYQTIRLIFNAPLNLTPESTVKEKEERLLTVLRKMQVPDLMCLLNNPFGVSFRISRLYLDLSERTKKIALRKLIKQLCYASFIALWVIAIDDCDFIDDESWEFFDTLFEIPTLFVLATKSRSSLRDTENSQKVLGDPRVKTMILRPVERSNLGALACQMLNVYAISPELEKAIQARSNGNPGWIESCLISMIQDDMLYVLEANLKEINDLGLVCPPLYMMSRLTNEEMVKWQHIMEEKRPSSENITRQQINWRKYIDTCRDSYLNVTIREQMESMPIGGKVPVCVIAPNFHVGDDEAELSIDAMILRTFDSLNFYEQLLVKCSAILGNQFFRNMLMYVMAASSPRLAAMAVQKLFEIRVLTCAKGDFLEGITRKFTERLINPVEDPQIRCDCSGLKVDDTCTDLPKYASCGYMQFRSTLFREITYNLLTDNQKKEFHQRAIRYLERETRRCKTCGGGYFESIIGVRHDKDLLNTRDKTRQQMLDSASWETQSVSHRLSLHSIGATSLGGTRRKSSRYDERSVILSNPSATDSPKGLSYTFGITMINKLKNCFSLTRSFSMEEFSGCQCNLILSTTYAQLIEHCVGANDLNKVLETKIEYAYISIVSSNIPLALKLLDGALNVLKQKVKEKSENLWQLSLIRGKVYTLIGFCRLELGHYDDAMDSLHKSLAEYGIRFPAGFRKWLKVCSNECKQFFHLYIFPRSMMKHYDHWGTIFANNLSECLSHLCSLYMYKGEWHNAKLAAAWSLSKAFASFSDFQVICTAYANMIYVAQHYQKWNLCVALEVHALRLMHLKKSRLEREDLKAVARLYGVIFCSRIVRSTMEKAIHIGYIVLRLCTSLRAVKIMLPLLPHLMHGLLLGKHITMSLAILQDLDFFADQDSDSSGKVWYFALCICFHLETGYTIVTYHDSEEFYQGEGETWVTIRDPDARKRYFTVMWLWCVRNEKWEAASLWCLKTEDFMVITENDSLSNKVTALYLLEGLILYLVSKLDRRNVEAVIKAENEIEHLIRALTSSSHDSQLILPRLYHLKAYYRFVKYNDQKVQNLLDKSKKYSEKFGNHLELSWLEHSVKAWCKQLPPTVADFWKEHAEPDNSVNFHELEINPEKLGFFTLPTPLYI